MPSRLILAAFAACLTASVALPANAQSTLPSFRSTSHRARMELGVDLGYGFGSEGDYLELATDFRVHAPFGLGAVVRFGVASRLLSNALAVDVGAAQRFDLVAGAHGGIQLALAAGLGTAYGPFGQHGDVAAYGGFGMVQLDFWTTHLFVGVGVSGHALLAEGERSDPILTVAPQVRLGGDWGL